MIRTIKIKRNVAHFGKAENWLAIDTEVQLTEAGGETVVRVGGTNCSLFGYEGKLNLIRAETRGIGWVGKVGESPLAMIIDFEPNGTTCTVVVCKPPTMSDDSAGEWEGH